jgi:hypothetical protein
MSCMYEKEIEQWYRKAINDIRSITPNQEIDIDLVYNNKNSNLITRFLSSTIYNLVQKHLSEETKEELSSYLNDLNNRIDPREQAAINNKTMVIGDKVIHAYPDTDNAMNQALGKFSNPQQRFNFLFFHEMGHFMDGKVYEETTKLLSHQKDDRAANFIDNLIQISHDTIKKYAENMQGEISEDVHFALSCRYIRERATEMYADCFSAVMNIKNGSFADVESITSPIIQARIKGTPGLSVFFREDSKTLSDTDYHNSSMALERLNEVLPQYEIGKMNMPEINKMITGIVEYSIIKYLHQGVACNEKFNDFLNSACITKEAQQKDLFDNRASFATDMLFANLSKTDIEANQDNALLYKMIQNRMSYKGEDKISDDLLTKDFNNKELQLLMLDLRKHPENSEKLMAQHLGFDEYLFMEAKNVRYESESDFGDAEISTLQACDFMANEIKSAQYEIAPSLLSEDKQLAILERVNNKNTVKEMVMKGINKIVYTPPKKYKYK